MTEKLHSTLGASSASRWMACAGSPKLCEKAPKQKESEFAAEGTLAHKVAEYYINQAYGIFKEKEFTAAETSEEMLEAVRLYGETVLGDCKTLKGELEVEKKVNLSTLFRGMFGTNDAIVYARWSKLIVYDFKYGAGVPVEVTDNVQLLYYALGAYIELQHLEFSEIELVIVQPRLEHRDGPVRRWTIPVTYLTAFAERLKAAAEATQKPGAALVAGPHCRWCPALPICPEAAKKVTDVAIQDFTVPVEKKTLKEPTALTLDQVRIVLDNAEFLDSWLRAVEQFAEDQAKSGVVIPGYKLVKKRSNRKWIDEKEAQKALEPKFGGKIFSTPSILSPAQMVTMIGKKNGGETIVETLAVSPDTGVVLVKETDARPAALPPALTDFS